MCFEKELCHNCFSILRKCPVLGNSFSIYCSGEIFPFPLTFPNEGCSCAAQLHHVRKWSVRFVQEVVKYYRVSKRGTPRLLIVPFFAILPNLLQHSLFISFGEFCQPPLLFQTHRLLIHVPSRQRQREAQATSQNCLLYMFFSSTSHKIIL